MGQEGTHQIWLKSVHKQKSFSIKTCFVILTLALPRLALGRDHLPVLNRSSVKVNLPVLRFYRHRERKNVRILMKLGENMQLWVSKVLTKFG